MKETETIFGMITKLLHLNRELNPDEKYLVWVVGSVCRGVLASSNGSKMARVGYLVNRQGFLSLSVVLTNTGDDPSDYVLSEGDRTVQLQIVEDDIENIFLGVGLYQDSKERHIASYKHTTGAVDDICISMVVDYLLHGVLPTEKKHLH